MEYLDLNHMMLNDQVLEYLMPMPALKEIRLDGTARPDYGKPMMEDGLTDKSLHYVSQCPNLEILSICEDCGFTEGGFAALRNCPRLRSLLASDAQVGDDCVHCIAKCEGLQVLSLTGNRITDDGVQYLEELHELRYLSVSFCKQLTLQAIPHLARIISLERLDINGNPCDDASSHAISGMPHLSMLGISRRNAISQDVLRDVQLAHPRLKVCTDMKFLQYPPNWSGLEGLNSARLKWWE